MKINDRIYWISGGPWGYLGNAYILHILRRITKALKAERFRNKKQKTKYRRLQL